MAPTTQQIAGATADAGDEKRMDPSDGKFYTKQEFIGYYHGTDQWDVAVKQDTAVAGDGDGQCQDAEAPQSDAKRKQRRRRKKKKSKKASAVDAESNDKSGTATTSKGKSRKSSECAQGL